MGKVGDGVFDFVSAELGAGGSVETGGTKAFVGAVGVGVLGAGMFWGDAAPAALTVVE